METADSPAEFVALVFVAVPMGRPQVRVVVAATRCQRHDVVDGQSQRMQIVERQVDNPTTDAAPSLEAPEQPRAEASDLVSTTSSRAVCSTSPSGMSSPRLATRIRTEDAALVAIDGAKVLSAFAARVLQLQANPRHGPTQRLPTGQPSPTENAHTTEGQRETYTRWHSEQ